MKPKVPLPQETLSHITTGMVQFIALEDNEADLGIYLSAELLQRAELLYM